MKLEKFYLMSDGAEYRIAKRMDIPRLRPLDLRLLVGVRVLGVCTCAGVCEYLAKYSIGRVKPNNAWNNLKHLCQLGLLVREGIRYSLSPRGREYLSYLRNYYVNKRL